MVWVSIVGLLLCVILLSIKLDSIENKFYKSHDRRVLEKAVLDRRITTLSKELRGRLHKIERRVHDVKS